MQGKANLLKRNFYAISYALMCQKLSMFHEINKVLFSLFLKIYNSTFLRTSSTFFSIIQHSVICTFLLNNKQIFLFASSQISLLLSPAFQSIYFGKCAMKHFLFEFSSFSFYFLDEPGLFLCKYSFQDTPKIFCIEAISYMKYFL